eukprot:222575-Lingulodinium_polyedra.AAC.1
MVSRGSNSDPAQGVSCQSGRDIHECRWQARSVARVFLRHVQAYVGNSPRRIWSGEGFRQWQRGVQAGDG